MSQTGLAQFDSTIQKTNVWLEELMARLKWHDRPRAYHALRAVLHALRDRLSVHGAVALGAQLPMLVRGFYYEGWHPDDRPPRERKKEAFLSQVAEAFRGQADVDPEELVRAVFQVLAGHVTTGEIEAVKRCLSTDLRALWA